MEALRWMLEREDRRWTFLVAGRHYLTIDHGSSKGPQKYRVNGEECADAREAREALLARTVNLEVAGYMLVRQPATRTLSDKEMNCVVNCTDVGAVELPETLRRTFLGKWELV